ncbi:hypothetical protein PC128_g24121 [Phytophthora cactorum]|nr:hypothetical protein PC128_g24121 [Phytophthora cactorum]
MLARDENSKYNELLTMVRKWIESEKTELLEVEYEEESTGEPEQVIAAGAVAETSDAVLIAELKGSDENDKEDNVDELRTARRRARKQAKRW